MLILTILFVVSGVVRPSGYGGPRTLPHYHGVVLPWRTGRHPWSVLLSLSLSTLHSWAHTHTHVKTVYDVSNRETFEALPRWLEELENYVPPEVVKIVVGNKLDKVRARARSPPSTVSPTVTCPADRTHTGILPAGADCRGRCVRTTHGMSIRRGVRKDGRWRHGGV